MSLTRVSDPDITLNKSFHRKNNSNELDVYEAARYFSGYNEAASYNCATSNQRVMGRASLDIPMRNPLPQQTHHVVEKQIRDKKYKQSSSPGGRLASFLNSLFNSTGSRKKKSKSTATMKDEEESPGRRKRRSSISHFGSSNTTTDTESFYSSSSFGFMTTPPCAYTPAKSVKEFRIYSDNKFIGPTKPASLQTAVIDDKRWLDEKLNFNNGNSGKHENVGAQYPSEEKENIKFNENDDGADSDSSSDLFELQNYDLKINSSGLSVYETTHIDTIKRGAPISNGAL